MSTRFTALTVREGDAFFLEDNEWRCLFDSGRHKTIVDLLRFKGIQRLNLAICSHNDADHADGFIALFKAGFQIDEIWLPGLWASVLQFVANNCRNRGEVEWNNGYYNGELDGLFSAEPVSEESFNQDMAYLQEVKKTKQFRESYESLHEDLAHRIIDDPRIIDAFMYRNLKNHFNRDNNEDYTRRQVSDYLEDSLENWSPRVARMAHRIRRDRYIEFEYYVRRGIYYKLRNAAETSQAIYKALNLKLKRILEIADLAKKRGCIIRWFEPLSSCTNEKIDHGFVAMNSRKICSIRIPKSGMAYMYLLSLTQENQYSLVFEYTKNDVPVIRFSADSNCTCRSTNFYGESIIVTAPHHGSPANANVYSAIRGNDIIWVRSDKLKCDRPCSEFKKRSIKYCLACQKYNFTSEICFEYNPVLKKWDCVCGEQCRCK